jgi:hypothetical protein
MNGQKVLKIFLYPFFACPKGCSCQALAWLKVPKEKFLLVSKKRAQEKTSWRFAAYGCAPMEKPKSNNQTLFKAIFSLILFSFGFQNPLQRSRAKRSKGDRQIICAWGHRPGQCHEIDHFNIGNLCGCLYWGAYRFMDVLYGGGGMPWEVDANIVHGICPDIFNQCSFRLIREERDPCPEKSTCQK